MQKYAKFIKKMNTRRVLRSSIFHLFSVATAVILFYWGLWRCYFFFDDYWMIGFVRFKSSLLEGMLAEFNQGYAVRPILDAHQWIRVRIFGLDAGPYYLTSLLQHIIMTSCVYGLATLLGLESLTAWLSALLFGTTFAANSAVNWISGSHYSLTYIPGLLSVCLFILFRKRCDNRFLAMSIPLFAVALFTGEWSVSILPQFIIYDLLVALDVSNAKRLVKHLRAHLFYWLWIIPYAVMQLSIIQAGSSEYSTDMRLGFHVLKNQFCLVHLVIPNFTAAPIQRFLNRVLPSGWFGLATVLSFILFALLVVFGIYLIWRGKPTHRFLVIWILAAFLPYTVRPPELAAADRYLYFPAVGFFILLSYGIMQWWQQIDGRWRLLAPILVICLLTLNFAFHQTWIQQQVRNGNVKRAVVRQLLQELPSPESGTHIIFEIPESNFRDLRHACALIYKQPIQCTAFVSGKTPPLPASPPWYWLRINKRGFQVVDSKH